MQNPLKRSVNTFKLEKRLRRQVGQAIQDFNMIEAGGRINILALDSMARTALLTDGTLHSGMAQGVIYDFTIRRGLFSEPAF